MESEYPRPDYIKAGVFEGDLISREALLKEVRENKELYEKERVYIEGLLLNAPTVKYPFYAEAYQTGYEEGKNARPQGDIRWTDKVFVKSNGDIIDFEGRVVGHINLEDMKGGAE